MPESLIVSYVAIRPHEVPERAPIRLEAGEIVSVGRRDTEWPEFVFVSVTRGSGWVPARHLSADHGEATVLVSYDTTELPLAAGDTVVVIERDDESGWWWCRSATGGEGWVPRKVLSKE